MVDGNDQVLDQGADPVWDWDDDRVFGVVRIVDDRILEEMPGGFRT